MIRRMLRCIAIGPCALTFMALLLPSAANAVRAEPAWSISTINYPTNFSLGSTATSEAGPALLILADNLGAAPTAGQFEVTDVLPTGLTVAPGRSPSGLYGGEGEAVFQMTCSSVAQLVKCSGASPSLGPGERIEVNIPVQVSSGPVAAPLLNEASVSGGGASIPASTTAEIPISSEFPEFTLLPSGSGVRASVSRADGSAVTQAGSHPYQLTIGLGFPSLPPEPGHEENVAAGGGLRDAEVSLPPGMVVDPEGVPEHCTEGELEAVGEPVCPPASQVGTVKLAVSLSGVTWGTRALYSMVPPPGTPAEFGFEVLEGTYVHLLGRVRSDGSYELAAGAQDVLAKVGLFGVETTFWGDPSDESHDRERGRCIRDADASALCPVPRTNTALLSMPSACSGPLGFDVAADSWVSPSKFVDRTAPITGLNGAIGGVEGCASLSFDPAISISPDTSRADSPTGLAVDLHVPQNESYKNEATGEDELATSTLKDAIVTLPSGIAINPSAANGRGACSPTQIGLLTEVGHVAARFANAPASCPDNSKIGTVEVESPLLENPLPGAIYLAEPYVNPFGSLLAVYIAVYDPQTGVVVKLAGKVDADPKDGQLTASFVENPQLPFEEFKLEFFGGPRAALRTPITCGSYSSRSVLTPWSGTAPVTAAELLAVSEGSDGAPCSFSAAQLPNGPAFEAGTVNPLAGAYSPFVLHLSRSDGSQELSSLKVTLPPGLTGKLAGTPYCPDPDLAVAAAKTGREEQASPSCPAASEVGRVTVGAGAGTMPFYAQGRAYLAGPYNGAPLSLAIVTPAVAGPYDLGDVVVRSALEVDPYSAQITVKSDPLPTILKGIPLDIRSIAIEIGKPGFTLNPTSCEPAILAAEAASTVGQVAHLQSHFQTANCTGLAFRPKIAISLKGGTKRAAHPALKAVVTYPKTGNYANIARAQVSLPHSEFLDQGNIGKTCTKPLLAARACPAKSIYGKAKAWTPLLEKPLEGNVYLVGGFGYKLPALVAELNGQIRILLKGKIDTDKQKGIRNTFEAVPDAPIDKFALEMKGGKKYGLLVNSENICKTKQIAGISLRAQNGRVLSLSSKIANGCKDKKGGRSVKHGKGRAR